MIIAGFVAGLYAQSITTTYSYTWKYDTTYKSQAGTKDFTYTGGTQTYAATAGTYTLQVWGAEGGGQRLSGNGSSGYGGYGGYSTGILTLTSSATLYIYVGGYGQSSSSGPAAGGWNGGGSGYASSSGEPGNGGGGGTDIRINSMSLYARVIVAGGGGGGGEDSGDSYGHGGGTTGVGYSSYDAGQTYAGTNGSFGQGATTNYGDGGGGGGGWYGGGTSQSGSTGSDTQGGGGGSGYVYTASTVGYYPSGCLLNSSHYLASAATYAGNTSFASTTGGTETGHLSNGHAKITYSFQVIDRIDSSISHTYVITTIIDSVCKNGFYNRFGFNVDGSSLSSGVHTFTHNNQISGKDSTTILKITIKPDPSTFLEVESPFSYFWPATGITYTESGIYSYGTVTADGCDSSVVLALTIYDPTIGIDENVDSQDVIIKPNPAKEFVDITSENGDEFDLTVYNIYGQSCMRKKVYGENTRVYVGDLPSGTYLFRICDNGGRVIVKKIIKSE